MMSHARSSAPSDQPYPTATGLADPSLLSKLVYRSRVVHPLSSLELYKLALAAQTRNRAESVTGLVIYDEGSFFQWLEGPAASLERIMVSIRRDRRHTDIEVLDSRSADTRLFAGWSMKLAAAGQAAASLRRDVMEPPPQLIEALRRTPRAAPRLLAAMMPVAAGASGGTVSEFRPAPSTLPLNIHAATILKSVIVETVIPELLQRQRLLRGKSGDMPNTKRVWELADLLIAADQEAALELIREVQAETAPSLQHYATLFEPAARRLGDLWGEDVCSEFDVAVGLSRIQTAIRLLNADVVRRRTTGTQGPDVLIAPEPGEVHGLGAALDSEVMWGVGWTPHCEYPRDDHALEDLVAASWFDVLDLSLSAAFRREHWLPRLKKTVSAARHASRNPALVVVVGGRLFAEHLAVGAQVGADAANTTSVHVDRSIMDRLRKES
jgi:methanogenic corrinoid protein MtbC1